MLPVQLHLNSRASVQDVMNAQQLAISAGLPVSAASRLRFRVTDGSRAATILLKSLNTKIKKLGQSPETKTSSLDWEAMEPELIRLFANPELSSQTGDKLVLPNVTMLNSLVKIVIAEAQRRANSGQKEEAIRLYKIIRTAVEHRAFQQTLISTLFGIANWNRYSQSLSKLDPQFRTSLPKELFEAPPSPDIKQILEHEFVFQWDQFSPRGQMRVAGAKKLTAMGRLEHYVLLKNWATLYPSMSNSTSFEEVAAAYKKVTPKLLPLRDMETKETNITLDVIDWEQLAKTFRKCHETLLELKRK